jgi:hypothetical protein
MGDGLIRVIVSGFRIAKIRPLLLGDMTSVFPEHHLSPINK